MQFALPTAVFAATSGTGVYVNATTITYGGHNYIDSNRTGTFKRQDQTGLSVTPGSECSARAISNLNAAHTSAKHYIYKSVATGRYVAGYECKATNDVNLTLTPATAAQTAAAAPAPKPQGSWVDSETITLNGKTYKKSKESVSGRTGYFLDGKPDKPDCGDEIGSISANYSTAKLFPRSVDGKNPACKKSGSSTDITLTNTDKATAAKTSTDGEGGQDACAGASGSYSWLLCPAVKKSTEFLEKSYEEFIEPLLFVKPLTTKNEDGSVNNTYAVWKAFVSLANVLFVLAFLGLIFGSVLNLDAYAVKKVLPRLIIAAIAVQVSYFICGVLVDVSNIFGDGLLDLIQNILKDVQPAGQAGSSAAQSIISYSILALGVTLFTAAAFLGPAIALMLIGFVISVFVFIITLLVRQLLITVLVILSPIAFVAWILPNTEGLFRKWKDNFVKMLFIYPIMSVFIGAAYIVQAASKDASAVAQITGGLAPMIAFFMMPAVFKMSGQAMGMAGGAIKKVGSMGSKVAKSRAEKAYDNSALLKQRQEKKLAKNIRLANAGAQESAGMLQSLRGRRAQSKLGLGVARTAGAQSAISAKQDAMEKEKASAATRQLRDLDVHGDEKDPVTGAVTKAAGEGFEIAMGQIGQKTSKGTVITEANQKASIAKMVASGNMKALARVKAQMEGTAGGAAFYKTATEPHFKDIKAIAPHLNAGSDPSKAFAGISSSDISKLGQFGTQAFVDHLTNNGAHSLSEADDQHFVGPIDPATGQPDMSMVQARKNARNQLKGMTASMVGNIKAQEKAVLDGAGAVYNGSPGAAAEQAQATRVADAQVVATQINAVIPQLNDYAAANTLTPQQAQDKFTNDPIFRSIVEAAGKRSVSVDTEIAKQKADVDSVLDQYIATLPPAAPGVTPAQQKADAQNKFFADPEMRRKVLAAKATRQPYTDII